MVINFLSKLRKNKVLLTVASVLPEEYVLDKIIKILPIDDESKVLVANALSQAAKKLDCSVGELLLSDEVAEIFEALNEFRLLETSGRTAKNSKEMRNPDDRNNLF